MLGVPVYLAVLAVSPDHATASQMIEILTFRGGYNTTLVLLGTSLLGLAAGVVGVFALLRNRSLVTDAVSHATLPGIVIAFLLAGLIGADVGSLPVLLLGAAATGVAGVWCIHGILRYSRLREDAAIGIVLSVFFGAGVVGLSYVQAHAARGSAGLTQFIYGQVATMRVEDVAIMAGIATLSILVAAMLLKEFSLVCFNDVFARACGWSVGVIDGVMLGLMVLVTVGGLQAVGLIMVVAMLIIPPVSARFWTTRLAPLVVISGAIGALSGYVGAAISAMFPGKPAGAVIVLTSGVVFLVSLLFAPSRGVLSAALRALRTRLRIASDHLLEAGYDAPGGERLLKNTDVDALARLRGWSGPFRRLVVFGLKRSGLLRSSPSGALMFTDSGLERGARVSRNHALWEQYLVRYAAVAPSHVDWSVDQVEHLLSPELVRELEAAVAAAESSEHPGEVVS